MTMSLKYLSSSIDPMNLDRKFDLLRPVVVAISFLLCSIISMTTLSTTPIAFFSFFSEPMFSNRFSFHMSGNGDIARCTDSLDTRSKQFVNLDSRKERMNGERRALGVVMELGLEDMVDIVRVGGDAIIEDVEVDASGAIRVAVIQWLDLEAEEEEGKDGKEDCEVLPNIKTPNKTINQKGGAREEDERKGEGKKERTTPARTLLPTLLSSSASDRELEEERKRDGREKKGYSVAAEAPLPLLGVVAIVVLPPLGCYAAAKELERSTFCLQATSRTRSLFESFTN
ncbi:uncharacterized protein DS421_1g18980 [Arachis hypogaea]|nr:uncharacterized protein DS421_1g18980 [Arachis hypogaea]